MRLDKLAVTAQEAVQSAMSVAADADAAMIEPIHLLKALMDADENNIAAIMKRIGADPVWISQNIEDAIAKMPKASSSAMPMAAPSQAFIKAIDNSVKIAEKLGDSYATSEHMLIALSEGNDEAGKLLSTAGITRKNIEAAYEALRGDTRVTSQTDKTQFEALEQYGQNLTQQAREGKMDPVIGRSEEIRRTESIQQRFDCHGQRRDAGSRYWPGGRNQAGNPDSESADEEQSLSDRRTGGRQDCRSGRTGSAHRGRRCSLQPEGQGDHQP